jgi:radical SAM superfamily enzyme YgiQ (UPF0313 family)
MRIAFVNPPYLYAYGKIATGKHCSFPLGLGYMAAYVREHGHEPAIFDIEAMPYSFDEIWQQILDFKPDLVAITSVTSNFTQAKYLAEKSKTEIGCLVVMGGPHVAALPKVTLQAVTGLDGVIIGEGEEPLRILADQYEATGMVDFSSIPSACFIVDGEFKRSTQMKLIEDLDSIPLPARDLVDMSWYSLQPHFERGQKSATILSSRGCPSKCTFCGNLIHGRRFRFNSPNYFVTELQMLRDKYGIRHFHIVDDCFSADPERVSEICQLILDRKLTDITWFIFGRADSLQDEKLIIKMRRAGCVYVLLGVESGSEHVLEKMRKETPLDTVRTCCKLLRKNRIAYFNSFIIGNVGETEDDVMKSIAFAKELKSVMEGFNIMTPFPGTYVFNKFYKDLANKDTNWDNFISVTSKIAYTVKHTPLSNSDVERLTALAYRQFYFNLPQIFRLLRFINNPRTLIQYIKGGFGILCYYLLLKHQSKTVNPVNVEKNVMSHSTNPAWSAENKKNTVSIKEIRRIEKTSSEQAWSIDMKPDKHAT